LFFFGLTLLLLSVVKTRRTSARQPTTMNPQRLPLDIDQLLAMSPAVVREMLQQEELRQPPDATRVSVLSDALQVLEADAQRAEADAQRAEADAQRAEADRQRAEADRQRAEADRQRAEADRQRAEALARMQARLAAPSAAPVDGAPAAPAGDYQAPTVVALSNGAGHHSDSDSSTEVQVSGSPRAAVSDTDDAL